MATQIDSTTRTAMVAAISTALGTSCKIEVFKGTRPAAGTAAVADLLVTFAGNASAFGSSSAGVLTAGAIASAAATASGTATWARLSTSGGTWKVDCDVTATAGAGPLKIDNTVIVSGKYVNVTSITFTAGNA